MISATTNGHVINRSTTHFHGGHYAYPSAPQQCHCQLCISNAFPKRIHGQQLSSGEAVNQLKETTAPFHRISSVYHNSSEVQYHISGPVDDNEGKRLISYYYYPSRFGENNLFDENTYSSKNSKAVYSHHQETRKEASTAHLRRLPKGVQKVELAGKNPGYHVLYTPREQNPTGVSRRYEMEQVETATKVKAKIYEAYLKGLSQDDKGKYLSEKEIVFLKPCGFQTQPISVPVSADDRGQMERGTQRSEVTQLGPRYSADFKNPRAPNTIKDQKSHLADPSWPRLPLSVATQAFAEPNTNGVHAPEVTQTDSIQPYPRGIVNPLPQKLALDGQLSVQSVRCHPSSVIVQNASRPALPFSHSEVPFSSHYLHGNSYTAEKCSPGRSHVATSVPSNGVHSSKQTAPSVNHYYPDEYSPLTNEYRQEDTNSAKFRESETPKCVHPKRVLVAIPFRYPDVLMEDRSQKVNFPVRAIPYVHPHGESYHAASSSSLKEDVSSSKHCNDFYNAREVHQNLSPTNGSLPFKSDCVPHYNGFAPDTPGYKNAYPSNEPSQGQAVEGLTTSPTQLFHCQPVPEGFCCPLGSGKGTPDAIISDSHSPLRSCHPKPGYPTTTARHPASVEVLATSNPRLGPMNGHVPPETYNIHHSEISAFNSRACHRGAEDTKDGRKAIANDFHLVLTPQPPRSIRSAGNDSKSISLPRFSNSIAEQASSSSQLKHPTRSNTLDEGHNSLTTKEPRCYISVDSKPQVEQEKEQSDLSHNNRRFPKSTQTQSPGVAITPLNHSHREDRLTKLTTFVVGLETQIQKPKKNARKESESETGMQIVSISSTQHGNQLPTDTPSDSSGSDSEDGLGMIRLERVYYSADPLVQSPNEVHRPSIPAPPHLMFDESGFDSQSWKSSAVTVDKKVTTSRYNLHQSNPATLKQVSAGEKDRKTPNVSGKRKTFKMDDNSAKGNEDSAVKRNKIKKMKTETVITILEKQQHATEPSQMKGKVAGNTRVSKHSSAKKKARKNK